MPAGVHSGLPFLPPSRLSQSAACSLPDPPIISAVLGVSGSPAANRTGCVPVSLCHFSLFPLLAVSRSLPRGKPIRCIYFASAEPPSLPPLPSSPLVDFWIFSLLFWAFLFLPTTTSTLAAVVVLVTHKRTKRNTSKKSLTVSLVHLVAWELLHRFLLSR